MSTFDPYENESDVLQIEELTLENREDRVTLHGAVDLTRDKQGLVKAKHLLDVLNKIVTKLEGESLPERLPAPVVARTRNPFDAGGDS